MPKLKSCGFLIYRDIPKDSTISTVDDHPAVSRSDTDRSFLLMKHSNRWDLPKGHVDNGETSLECALRELEEETGIAEDDIEIDPNFKFKLSYKVAYKRLGPDPVKKKLIIFLARLKNEISIRPTEHEGYEWFVWAPPHSIQKKTVDPLLAQLADFWS